MLHLMNEDLIALRDALQLALDGLTTDEGRQFLRRAIFRKEGLLDALLGGMRYVDPAVRRTRGAALNQFKADIDAMFERAEAT